MTLTIMQKKWKWIGYVLYGLFLTTGLLYYRFPADTIRVYMESSMARANPRILVSLKGLRPGFPPGVDLEGARISLKETPQKPLLRAKKIAITPDVWSFVSGISEYYFDARAYQGDIKGRVRFDRHNVKAPFAASVLLKGIHVGRHPYLPPLVGRDVSGVLEGKIDYTGQRNRFIDGTGHGTLVISDGRVQLLQPILGLDALNFDRLSVKMALKDRKVALTRLELEGPAVKGELSGTIFLKSNVSRSRLDLRGSMEPLGGLLGNIKADASALRFLRQGLKGLNRSFVIQGTLENPEFKFI
ncbi:MAG: type II secretion system protein GspN [Deltaproteobacteria bacterium]|nr:type II secretion system protein GspN [Deltaproteobacteria bacterium]